MTYTFYTVPQGLFVARNQTRANRLARNFAYVEARKFPCCINALPPYACLNQPYNQTLSLNTGEVATWGFFGGTLPPGITFTGGSTNQATLTGTTMVEGSYTFTIGVTTAENTFSFRTFNICVTQIESTPLETSPGVLPNATQNVPYTVTFGFVTCVTETGVWSVNNGTLPPGLTLNASQGTLSGTPTTNGTYPFTLLFTQKTHSAPFTCQKDFSITVGAGISDLPPYACWMQGYDQYLSLSTGEICTWSLSGGTLPTGVNLTPTTDTSVEIFGTPSITGNFTFTVLAITLALQHIQRTYTVCVIRVAASTDGSPSVGLVTLPPAYVGVPYNSVVTWSLQGCVGAVGTWSLSGPSPWMSINPSTGVITGTPTFSGVALPHVESSVGCGRPVEIRICDCRYFYRCISFSQGYVSDRPETPSLTYDNSGDPCILDISFPNIDPAHVVSYNADSTVLSPCVSADCVMAGTITISGGGGGITIACYVQVNNVTVYNRGGSTGSGTFDLSGTFHVNAGDSVRVHVIANLNASSGPLLNLAIHWTLSPGG